MTQFIESFGNSQLLPPWVSRDVETWLFALSLHPEGIEWFVTNYLNGTDDEVKQGLVRAPYVYERILGTQYAFLVITDHPGAKSIHGDDHKVPNRRVYVTIPVLRKRVAPNNIVVESKVVWFRTVDWCDSSTFVFSAREIWGADVEFQTIDRDPTVTAPALHLDTSYIGVEPFEPSGFNEKLAALHVRVGGRAPDADDLLRSLDGQLEDLLAKLVGIQKLRPAAKGLPEAVGAIDIDALKQFRAAEDMGQAIYRALVTSRQWHTEVRDLVVHDVNEVEVDFMSSATLSELQERFGLTVTSPGQRGVPTPSPGLAWPMPQHLPVRPPPPAEPGAPPTEVRWDLERTPARVKVCLSFKADLYFEVIDTLHVYRPQA